MSVQHIRNHVTGPTAQLNREQRNHVKGKGPMVKMRQITRRGPAGTRRITRKQFQNTCLLESSSTISISSESVSRAPVSPRLRQDAPSRRARRPRSFPLSRCECCSVSAVINRRRCALPHPLHEGGGRNQIPTSTKSRVQSGKEVMEVCRDEPCSLNLGCLWTGHDESHKKHGIRDKLGRNGDNEERSLLPAVVLGGRVGEG